MLLFIAGNDRFESSTMFKNMNRHTKVAMFVAPLLVLFGWIGGEIWVESQAMKKKFYTLEPEAGFCDVMAKKCVLSSGDFKLSLYQEDGKTTMNSTFPLDTATFFMVDGEEVTAYRMGMIDSPYYWYQVTDFANENASPGSKQTLRVIATIKGSKYIGEFVSKTVGTRVID